MFGKLYLSIGLSLASILWRSSPQEYFLWISVNFFGIARPGLKESVHFGPNSKNPVPPAGNRPRRVLWDLVDHVKKPLRLAKVGKNSGLDLKL